MLKLRSKQHSGYRPIGYLFSPAFTIVELLVVIVVIGILATITIVSYTGISNRAITASVVSDLDNTLKQFKLFQIDNSGYPTGIELNCNTPVISTNKCIKLSGSNTLGVYYVNNSITPQTFCLTIKNGPSIIKNITQDGIISDGACTYPFASTLVATTASSSQINLSWGAITGATSYTVQRDTDSTFTTPAPTTVYTGSSTSTSDTGLTSATIYYYRAKVTISGDASSWSNTASATTKATLTIAAGANGTVNTGVNGDYTLNSTPTITATPNSGYLFNNWTGGTGCSGTTTASYAITMDGNKTCTASFVVDPWANWYPGIAATALAGKHVYKTDLGLYQYKPTGTAVTSPQGATGLDPNYPSKMSLVSPQTNPGVDFSAYPAQYACKAIGGRLPNMQELLAIYAGRVTYGNNFQANYYWSSTEYSIDYVYGVSFSNGSSTYTSGIKSILNYVRCVSG